MKSSKKVIRTDSLGVGIRYYKPAETLEVKQKNNVTKT